MEVDTKVVSADEAGDANMTETSSPAGVPTAASTTVVLAGTVEVANHEEQAEGDGASGADADVSEDADGDANGDAQGGDGCGDQRGRGGRNGKRKKEDWKKTRREKRVRKRRRCPEAAALAAEVGLGDATGAKDVEATLALSTEEKKKARADKKAQELASFIARCDRGATVVLDLEWEDDMNHKENKSLIQQVMYSYGLNRAAMNPVHLVLSGLARVTQTRQGLDKMAGFPHGWPGVIVSEVPYIEHFASVLDKSRLVYLTADADNVLTCFESDKVYIIGGIVDHNRLKGVTLRKAEEQGIATARLPLQEHIEMGSFSRVLTVNHCVGIVLTHQETGSWRSAFEKHVPGRKQFLDVGEAGDGDGGIDASLTTGPHQQLSRHERRRKQHNASVASAEDAGSNGVGAVESPDVGDKVDGGCEADASSCP